MTTGGGWGVRGRPLVVGDRGRLLARLLEHRLRHHLGQDAANARAGLSPGLGQELGDVVGDKPGEGLTQSPQIMTFACHRTPCHPRR
jgi:hypothetical protein